MIFYRKSERKTFGWFPQPILSAEEKFGKRVKHWQKRKTDRKST